MKRVALVLPLCLCSCSADFGTSCEGKQAWGDPPTFYNDTSADAGAMLGEVDAGADDAGDAGTDGGGS